MSLLRRIVARVTGRVWILLPIDTASVLMDEALDEVTLCGRLGAEVRETSHYRATVAFVEACPPSVYAKTDHAERMRGRAAH